jgi:hypothetical protein
MNREDRFVMSHRPYAVDLGILRTEHYADFWVVRAAWYRRKNGVTAACVGTLRGFQGPRPYKPAEAAPANALEFVTALGPGHYGDCLGRWDGTGYWGSEVPATATAHLALLQPMLERYPEVPSGFDGWWTFR